MRNVTELSKLPGKVYVYLNGPATTEKFLQAAEAEGFTFGDGARPKSRPGNDLYAVGPDHTISHCGFTGHMAFQAAKTVGGQKLIRVDYEKYLAGGEDYMFLRK